MRLIDADALIDDFRKTIEDCKKREKDAKDSWTKTKAEHALQDFIEAVLRVKAAPTVDAVPVIFCDKCKHWDKEWKSEWENTHYCPMIDLVADADFFCMDGERKDGVDNA